MSKNKHFSVVEALEGMVRAIVQEELNTEDQYRNGWNEAIERAAQICDSHDRSIALKMIRELKGARTASKTTSFTLAKRVANAKAFFIVQLMKFEE
jgi:hypothetical protein